MLRTEEININRLIDPFWDASTKDRVEAINSLIGLYVKPFSGLKVKSLDISVVFEDCIHKAFLVQNAVLDMIDTSEIEHSSIDFSVDPDNFGIFIKLTYEDDKVMIQPYE